MFDASLNADSSSDFGDLRLAVSRLPRRQREIVFLYYFMDLEVAEAANILGIGEGTVKKALHRARQTLATSLYETDEAIYRRNADGPPR